MKIVGRILVQASVQPAKKAIPTFAKRIMSLQSTVPLNLGLLESIGCFIKFVFPKKAKKIDKIFAVGLTLTA